MLFNLGSIAIAALATGASLVQARSDPFVIHSLPPIAVARIDPIVNPGEVGSHVHSLFGASNIRNVLNTPEEQLNAECTSAIAEADKSNYWAPTLYYIRKDGTYEGMVHSARAYYFTPPNATPWPPGMRIVTGTAMSRDLSDTRTRGIFIDVQRKLGWFLPNTTSHPTYPGGPKTGIHFPSCGWANQSLDSWDHFSHLAWPINTGGGKIWDCIRCDTCPESHPIKYPTMFLEVGYYPSEAQAAEWGTRQEHFALSNGDTLGTSFHADFVNGWEPQVLQGALKECSGVGENLGACAPIKNSGIDVLKMTNCRIQGMIPDEEVGWVNPLKQLPGCNPLWTANMGDDKPTNCADRLPDPGWTPPNAMWNEFSREGTLPLAVQMDPRGEANFTDFKPTAGKDAILTPWGQDQWGRYAKFLNKDSIMIGTAQDIADNLNMDTAVFKNPQVQGMKDSSAFTGLTPPTVVGKEAWQIKAVPSGVPTYLAMDNVDNGIPRPTGGAAGAPVNNGATPTNASDVQATPAPSAGGNEAPVVGNNAANNATGESSAGESPASESPTASAPAAESPAASPSGTGASSASGSASKPAVDASASASQGPAPGGANNLVADGGEIASAITSASPAATPAVSGSNTKPAGGGKKQCHKRRRRRGSRLH